jgi:hypothetical protein
LLIISINFVENEPKIKHHPKSYYTSRKINYSAKLNEYLAQDSLSDKIVVTNYDNKITVSEDLSMYNK